MTAFITFDFPHHAEESSEVQQTKRLRGKVALLLALDHLYPLEHHMYPSVPHQNWPKLAKLLNTFLDTQKAKVIRFFV